jgi:D-lactate dehydrogenase
MKIAVFSTRPYDRQFPEQTDRGRHELAFIDARLQPSTVAAATGAHAVCAFVDGRIDAGVLHGLHELGVRLVLLRSAGFNHIDLAAAVALASVSGGCRNSRRMRWPSTPWRCC